MSMWFQIIFSGYQFSKPIVPFIAIIVCYDWINSKWGYWIFCLWVCVCLVAKSISSSPLYLFYCSFQLQTNFILLFFVCSIEKRVVSFFFTNVFSMGFILKLVENKSKCNLEYNFSFDLFLNWTFATDVL